MDSEKNEKSIAGKVGQTNRVRDFRRLYTPKEAAELLGISRAFVFKLLGAGELESVAIGSARRVPAEALDDFVDRLRRKGHL